MKGAIINFQRIHGKTIAGDYIKITFHLDEAYRNSNFLTTRAYSYSGLSAHSFEIGSNNYFEIEIAEHFKDGDLEYTELEKLTEATTNLSQVINAST